MTWKWTTFLGETGGAFVNHIRKKTTGIKPINSSTDAQMTQSADVVIQLKAYNPMNENELDSELINSICKKIKQGRELDARGIIEQAATSDAKSWCIDSLKAAVTIICSCGPTVVKGATFNLLECD